MPNDQEKDELCPLAVTLFERLCAEARYARFFTAMRVLPEKMLDSATHPLPDREVALVAISDEGSRKIIIGGARYVLAAF